MTKRLVECCLVLISLSLTQGSITSLCATSDSYWEVQEGEQDNTFTCTGLSATDSVQWFCYFNSTAVDVGLCPPRQADGSQPVCTQPVSPIFKPARVSDGTSVMIVNDTAASDFQRELFKWRLVCQVVLLGSSPPTAGCRLDYIYASEKVSCTVQFRQENWTVFGQCSFTKSRSVHERYRCEWICIKESSSESTFVANTSESVVPNVGTSYVSGSCNVTSDLPPEGWYTYRVTVVPGEVTVNASFIGSNQIRRPDHTPSHNCPLYVAEGSDLNCTCFVSDPGSPPGVLQWNSTQSTQLYLSNVQAWYSETHVCQLLWNKTVSQRVQYNVNVAYGPRNVTPVVLNPQPLDTNGLQNISLNCVVSGSNPSASVITWIRSHDQSTLCNSQLCSTSLKPPDNDGVKFECVGRNPVTNRTNSGSVTVALNYPPTAPPEISRNPSLTDSQPVYEGDNVTLTCTVHGGKPVNATLLTFTCPNKPDMPDNSVDAVNIITSSLTFSPVSPSNHDNCTCHAIWKNYDWYNRTVSWSLVVYTPPSVPVIFPAKNAAGRLMYPFMVGTSGTLYCQSNQTGRPEATYTWPVAASGHVSGSNLTFYQLTREDNGRLVTCRASNSYTENRRPVDDATFVLDIYYEAEVNFMDISDTNSCSAFSTKSNYTQCVVAEGQRVHINCTADSNPPPASFKWTGKDNETYSNTSELMIASANHTIHSGDYNCTVVTKQENGDSRLPLTSSAILTLIVGYSPTILTFNINNMDNTVVNVMEKSHVDMKCLANGRPTPVIQIINATDPLQSLNQSQIAGDRFVEQTQDVSFSINNVPCEASGVYRCEANNMIGQDNISRMLTVSCAPRRLHGDEESPVVVTTDGKGELNVRMTAYPTPKVENMTYYGVSDSDNGRPVKEDSLHAVCYVSPLVPSAVACIISVMNITDSDVGYYRIVFSNSLGAIAFTFSVKEATQSETDSKANENVGAVIALAVVSTVVLVLIVVAVIWFWRRGWTFPCADNRGQSNTQLNQLSVDTSEQSLTPITTKESTRAEGAHYDFLRLEDVGMRSPYEEIRRDDNTRNVSQYEVLTSSCSRETKDETSYVNI